VDYGTAALDTVSLSLFPDIFSSAKANLVIAMMIASAGLAQNQEQFVRPVSDVAFSRIFALSQTKSLFLQDKNETF
jgi:hypothetical protein